MALLCVVLFDRAVHAVPCAAPCSHAAIPETRGRGGALSPTEGMMGRPPALSAIPCFPAYSFLPKVEQFFIPKKMFLAQPFCLLYLCWQLYSIAPCGGRLGFGLCVSHDLLRSKLLPGGLRSKWIFENRNRVAPTGAELGKAQGYSPSSYHLDMCTWLCAMVISLKLQLWSESMSIDRAPPSLHSTDAYPCRVCMLSTHVGTDEGTTAVEADPR